MRYTVAVYVMSDDSEPIIEATHIVELEAENEESAQVGAIKEVVSQYGDSCILAAKTL